MSYCHMWLFWVQQGHCGSLLYLVTIIWSKQLAGDITRQGWNLTSVWQTTKTYLFEFFNLPSPKLMANGVSGGVSSLGLFAGVFLGFLLTQLETCWEFCFWPWLGLISKAYCQLESISLDSPHFNLNLTLSIFHLHLTCILHLMIMCLWKTNRKNI